MISRLHLLNPQIKKDCGTELQLGWAWHSHILAIISRKSLSFSIILFISFIDSDLEISISVIFPSLSTYLVILSTFMVAFPSILCRSNQSDLHMLFHCLLFSRRYIPVSYTHLT